MTATRIRWVVLALLYAAFHFWYGGSGDPLSSAEVGEYAVLAEALGSESAERLTAFAATDDGGEFVMVNLNLYRDEPVYADGRDVEGTSEEIEVRYTSKMVPRLLARACHPLISVEPVLNLGGQGEFERTLWDRATMVRYRSRRDFLDILLKSDFSKDVAHKFAALERTHSFPSTPVISLVTMRLVPLLALACIGLLLDRILGRAR